MNKDTSATEQEIPQDADIIAIDGPAAAGKTTLAKRLAALLGYQYLDTGAMYRAIAVWLEDLGIRLDDSNRLLEFLTPMQLTIQFSEAGNRISINGEDYTDRIRNPKAAALSSIASTNIHVREKLVLLQRAIGAKGKVIAEGRDIGTVVFPNARYKFFLTASLEARGSRRFREETSRGKPQSLEQTLTEIEARDMRDSTRQHSPLKPAPDAIIIDTTDLDADQVVAVIQERLRNRG